MHVVDVLFSPLSEVTNKAIEVVALGHVNSAILVVGLKNELICFNLHWISSINKKVMYSLSIFKIREGRL